MNPSQLLSANNRLRKSFREKLLQKEPVLKNSFQFDEFFTKAEASTRSIFKTLKQKDNSGRTLAEKLAQNIEKDSQKNLLTEDFLFHSLHDFGVNDRFHGLDINESAAQEILGSLFETLDTLIRVQDDQDSHIGETDRQIDLNLDRLSDLIENFDEMVSQVAINLSDSAIKNLTSKVAKLKNFIPYSDLVATLESVKGEKRKAKV